MAGGEDRKKNPASPDLKVVDRRSARLREAAGDGDPAGPAVEDAPASSDAEAERRYPSYVEELRSRAEEAERRFQEVLAAHRQAVADQEEFRRRLNRDVEKRVESETGQVLAGLLGVFDDLDRAVRHAEETRASEDSALAAALLDGVRLVRDRFLATLRQRGVERIEVLGAPFDPQTAEALRTETVEPERDGLVTEEISPGFRYRGQVIRPARVTVGRAVPSPRG